MIHHPSFCIRPRVPRRIIYEVGRDLVLERRRSLASDAAAMVEALRPPARVEGLEHVPIGGPFVLVANHFQRPGLWIGWAGALLTDALHRQRGGDPPVHWLVLGGWMRGGRPEPVTRWAFRRVARNWGLVPLLVGSVAGRRAALAELLRLALPAPRGQGRPIGFFPEGPPGVADQLGPAQPGSGSLLLRLAGADVPTLPAAVGTRSDGRLLARFGPCFLPRSAAAGKGDRDADVRAQTMAIIGGLLAQGE